MSRVSVHLHICPQIYVHHCFSRTRIRCASVRSITRRPLRIRSMHEESQKRFSADASNPLRLARWPPQYPCSRSGQKYMVGDQDDYCKSLSCFGGKPGQCQSTAGPWQGQQVMCGGRASPPLLELSVIDGLAGTGHGSVVLERIGLDGAHEAAETSPVCLDGKRAHPRHCATQRA